MKKVAPLRYTIHAAIGSTLDPDVIEKAGDVHKAFLLRLEGFIMSIRNDYPDVDIDVVMTTDVVASKEQDFSF